MYVHNVPLYYTCSIHMVYMCDVLLGVSIDEELNNCCSSFHVDLLVKKTQTN